MGSSAAHRQQLSSFKTIALSFDAATRVAYLALGRPDRSNSVNEEMWSELPQVKPAPPPRSPTYAFGTARDQYDAQNAEPNLDGWLAGSRHAEQSRRRAGGESAPAPYSPGCCLDLCTCRSVTGAMATAGFAHRSRQELLRGDRSVHGRRPDGQLAKRWPVSRTRSGAVTARDTANAGLPDRLRALPMASRSCRSRCVRQLGFGLSFAIYSTARRCLMDLLGDKQALVNDCVLRTTPSRRPDQ